MKRTTLKAARRKAGWSQMELAERAGVDQTTVSTLETGRRSPLYETVKALAGALGMRPDQLTFRAGAR